MGRLLLAVVFASAAALGQQQTQSDAPKLDPYRAKALENALRPLNSFSKKQKGLFSEITQPPLTALTLLPAAPSKPVEVCAIPLTRFPVDAEIDRGIQHALKPEARHADDMPIAKLMPTCPEDHPLTR
jgi:hypothetical protein